MHYSTFNRNKNDIMKEPMFFGQNVNVSRFDKQKYAIFEKLTERQLSFFWRPEEIDATQMMDEYNGLKENEKHIFISNLKYQTLLDSVQGRSPNVALLPVVSLPELETWIETWSFFETIHSRSYTHIIRNSFADPSIVLDDIVVNEHILARAKDIAKYYDDFIIQMQILQSQGTGTYYIDGEEKAINLRNIKRSLYLCMNSIYALEAIRFYVSFACSFAFGERELLDANARIIKLISRDEALHMAGTQTIMNLWRRGDDDPEMGEISEEMRDYGEKIFFIRKAAPYRIRRNIRIQQEKIGRRVPKHAGRAPVHIFDRCESRRGRVKPEPGVRRESTGIETVAELHQQSLILVPHPVRGPYLGI